MRILPFTTEMRWVCATLFLFLIIVSSGFNKKRHPAEFEIPFKTLLRQPDDITCGPTSLAMLLNFYGQNIPVEEVKKLTKTVWYTRDGVDFGMTAPEMIRSTLEHFGFRATLNHGNLDTLKHYVSLGKPCVVLVRSTEYNWHYVVVVGFKEGMIYFANPTYGEIQAISEQDFVRAWNWSGDLLGRDCSWWVGFWLRSIEIYPNSFVCSD